MYKKRRKKKKLGEFVLGVILSIKLVMREKQRQCEHMQECVLMILRLKLLENLNFGDFQFL